MSESRAASHRPGLEGRIGIIDIGSNSIRLVVYEQARRAPVPVFNEKVPCGLGRDLERTGALPPDGVASALDNLQRFVTLARNMKVVRLDLLATAAVRDASDGEAFVAEVERRTGEKVQIISGNREAQLSGLGVVCGMPGADGVMGDLGGGSLELMALDHGKLGQSVTLPLGPLRLQALNGKRTAKEVIDGALSGVKWLQAYRGRTFFPVGGAWRAFARLHMEQVGYPLHVIHEYRISGREGRELAAMLSQQSLKSLEKIVGVSRRRLETLPISLQVLERVLAILQPKALCFSAFGLREGFFYNNLSAAEQKRDPLIAYAEDEGQRWRRFELMPEEIHDWTSPLFKDETAQEARLRRAASLLSDIGWADHPDYRGEQALLRVLRMPAPGIDHRERAMLALALMWRYKSGVRGEDAAMTLNLIEDEWAAVAQRIGTSLRLAYNLSGGAPGLLPRTALHRGKGIVRLVVPPALRNQLGDVTERRLEAVAEAFDSKAEIVIDELPEKK
ncbi:MAG: exopolyphosphatase [Alphaproteobacteria bacterium]|jgi:exopolyphosphatase/guanosine-5'-triphosphate,3'-diphosphate pyrophosphatase|nr:exopolyphosphatase [Alphaproteobacteria bacterium]